VEAPGPPMTLGNIRANGVRSLAVWCGGRGCNHQAVLDVSAFPDDVPVPMFGPRMVCTRCGIFGADAPSAVRVGFASGAGSAPCIAQGGQQSQGVAAINPVMHQEASEEGAHLRPPRESQGHPSATPMAAVSSESRPQSTASWGYQSPALPS